MPIPLQSRRLARYSVARAARKCLRERCRNIFLRRHTFCAADLDRMVLAGTGWAVPAFRGASGLETGAFTMEVGFSIKGWVG